MTLILAAKHQEGIVTVSDTIGYGAKGSYYTQKVRPIGNGTAIMGFAGEFLSESPDEHIARYSQAMPSGICSKLDPREPLRTLSSMVSQDTKAASSDPDWFRSPANWNAYLFGIEKKGIFKSSEVSLYVHDQNSNIFSLQPVSYYDLGTKFPEVRQILEESANSKGSIEDLIFGMKRALEMGKELSRANPSTGRIIQGTQVGIFTKDGYKVLEFSEN